MLRAPLAGLAVILLVAAPLAGCVERATEDDPPSVETPETDPTAPRTAQDLIAAALAAGRISSADAVRYRAYALFGDARLPEEYRALPSSGEDRALFPSIESAGLAEELAPFLVRPTDPTSVFARAAEPQLVQAGFATVARAQAAGDSEEPRLLCDAHGWSARASTVVNATVWVGCEGTMDAIASRDAEKLVRLVESMWLVFAPIMGEPLPDRGGAYGGGSKAIDFYLVDSATPESHGGRDTTIDRTRTMAYSRSTGPDVGHASSAYVVLGREQLDRADFPLTLAHEVFHVFQSAHNDDIAFKCASAGACEEWWFVESSAEWAAAHAARVTGVAAAALADHLHDPRFGRGFQVMPSTALNTRDPTWHPYAAYVWPLFMEQERGARVVGDVWRSLHGTTSWDEGDALVSDALPFKDNFREFAMRNLLLSDLQESDPVAPRYRDLDPSFPTLAEPLLSALELGPREEPITSEVAMQPLSAYYERIRLEEGATQLKLDFAPLDAPEGVNVDAVVKTLEGAWERRTLDARGATRLCDVEQVVLVFSNGLMRADDAFAGEFMAHPLAKPCSCDAEVTGKRFEGELKLTYAQEAEGTWYETYFTVRMNRDVAVTATLEPQEEGSASYFGLASGSVVVEDDMTWKSEYDRGSHATRANGPPGKEANLQISFDAHNCRYIVSAALYATGGGFDDVHPDLPAWLTTDWFPIPEDLNITGGMDVPAVYNVVSPGYHLWPTREARTLRDLRGDDLGIAHVTWSFREDVLTPLV